MNSSRTHSTLVIHPLDDLLEQKVGPGHLPSFVMTRTARFSLFALRDIMAILRRPE